MFKKVNIILITFLDELSNVSNEPPSNSILSSNDSINYTEETQQNELSDSDKTQKKDMNENNSDCNKSTLSKTSVLENDNVDIVENTDIKVKEKIPEFNIDNDKRPEKVFETISDFKVRKLLKYFKYT